MTLDKYLTIAECLPKEQEPCSDAISRQAALDAIMGEPTDAHYPSWYAKRIEDLPPVHAVPKTGHWINRYYIANKVLFKRCSECNYEYSYDAETGISDANYCPNCGAKMEERA